MHLNIYFLFLRKNTNNTEQNEKETKKENGKTKETKEEKEKVLLWTLSVENLTRYVNRIRC